MHTACGSREDIAAKYKKRQENRETFEKAIRQTKEVWPGRARLGKPSYCVLQASLCAGRQQRPGVQRHQRPVPGRRLAAGEHGAARPRPRLRCARWTSTLARSVAQSSQIERRFSRQRESVKRVGDAVCGRASGGGEAHGVRAARPIRVPSFGAWTSAGATRSRHRPTRCRPGSSASAFCASTALVRACPASIASAPHACSRRSARVSGLSCLGMTCTGELPDIQIPHRDVLAPLQALHADHIVARHIFLAALRAALASTGMVTAGQALRESVRSAGVLARGAQASRSRSGRAVERGAAGHLGQDQPGAGGQRGCDGRHRCPSGLHSGGRGDVRAGPPRRALSDPWARQSAIRESHFPIIRTKWAAGYPCVKGGRCC